ncbi:hypothetical protein IEQ34_000998 [Dendrobium chrysotoxum]|uniref:Mitochondrial splicing suppressor 51-like C-terminal domain-containing protein n=1 Tax=Dendrobium chrysotoxum TaxID=161865 RepID=A0AAV7H5K0_DENCH|nr:hypothetical protein IEQ34_000998 [Dendrobium chrysotoxum]
MECAAKGRADSCVPGPPKRRCGNCGAVAYCSLTHQGFERQLTRCSFLASSGLHRKALWKFECSCWAVAASLDNNSRLNDGWDLPSSLCPCSEPRSCISTCLQSWEDYYRWRGLPFNSPAAMLLHWPLTIFHCFQLYASQSLISATFDKLFIHYLGPEKELSQLAVFGELRALLPCVQLQIEFVGPGVPQDGETIKIDTYLQCSDGSCSCKSSCQQRSSLPNSVVTLKLYKGFYHEKYRDMDTHPQLVIAPNAGITAYPSWLPSIELISEMNIPAIFTDFCEEAAFLAARCISTVTGRPLSIPIQVNPFRQPMVMEDQALYLPCYSNCFIFGHLIVNCKFIVWWKLFFHKANSNLFPISFQLFDLKVILLYLCLLVIASLQIYNSIVVLEPAFGGIRTCIWKLFFYLIIKFLKRSYN